MNSTPRSSESPTKPASWTRSREFCWRFAGKRWRTPPWRHLRSPEQRREYESESAISIIGARSCPRSRPTAALPSSGCGRPGYGVSIVDAGCARPVELRLPRNPFQSLDHAASRHFRALSSPSLRSPTLNVSNTEPFVQIATAHSLMRPRPTSAVFRSLDPCHATFPALRQKSRGF
jgi:hypothetical protein